LRDYYKSHKLAAPVCILEDILKSLKWWITRRCLDRYWTKGKFSFAYYRKIHLF